MRIGVLVATLFLAGLANADELAKQARHHFDEATAAYNIGDFARATVEYREAYRLVHDPVLLYDAAQACRLGNDPSQALFLYRSYLRALPSAANRSQVEERIAALEKQLMAQPANPEPTPKPPIKQEELPKPPPPPPQMNVNPVPTATGSIAAKITERHSRTPVYKKWWLWTIVGVVAAGAAVGIGLGVTSSSSTPTTDLGVARLF
jgi:hypothetical protein